MNKRIVIVVIASFLGVVMIVGLVLGMGKIKTFLGGATGSLKPEGVRVGNISANSATITWQTSKPTAGQVEYGTTPGSFLLRTVETQETTDHSLTLSPLLPETIYYFRIRMGEEVYDENGAPYSFTTKVAVASAASSFNSSSSPSSSSATPVPTLSPVIPTSSASGKQTATSSSTARYTIDDFVAKFGSTDSNFDINKDGVVNSNDWILYQKQ